MRVDRPPNALRPVQIELDVQRYAEGSALIRVGDTAVICAVSVDERTAPFRRGSGLGWLTAEYAMLPRATRSRTPREVTRGRPSGRSQEIQRLIGRALRAVVDFEALGERTLWVDCDVLQADGGTRTAAITGAWCALHQACAALQAKGAVQRMPVREQVAAVSVGIVDGSWLLDLCYEEDSGAAVDMNVVELASSQLVEVQGTGETASFSRADLNAMLDLAEEGLAHLFEVQRKAVQRA